MAKSAGGACARFRSRGGRQAGEKEDRAAEMARDLGALASEWLVASEEEKASFVNSVGLVKFYELASDAQRRQLEKHLPTARWREENGLAGVRTTIAHEEASGVRALPAGDCRAERREPLH
jgi:hypothetical protein